MVSGALADGLLEALDGLDVVVEDVRPGLHDRVERRVRAVEVGDEDLDAHARALAAQGTDGLREDVRATVRQVVAGDAGHDHVLEAHLADRLGHPARLVLVVPGRATGLDGAEAAGTGAGVAEDHDRRRALLPALPDVGAAGLFADRVEGQVAQHALQLVIVGARWQPSPDPFGVPTERLRAVRRRRGKRAAAHRDGQGLASGMCMATLAGRREDGQLATHQLHSGRRRYISPVLGARIVDEELVVLHDAVRVQHPEQLPRVVLIAGGLT